ncbi:hypothetical protein ACJJTC_001214 [Scirpophaga incertulas]
MCCVLTASWCGRAAPWPWCRWPWAAAAARRGAVCAVYSRRVGVGGRRRGHGVGGHGPRRAHRRGAVCAVYSRRVGVGGRRRGHGVGGHGPRRAHGVEPYVLCTHGELVWAGGAVAMVWPWAAAAARRGAVCAVYSRRVGVGGRRRGHGVGGHGPRPPHGVGAVCAVYSRRVGVGGRRRGHGVGGHGPRPPHGVEPYVLCTHGELVWAGGAVAMV